MARISYMPGLDGLRAYAVMIVLLFHCGLTGFSGGWIGVDVFFGLSGFLITGILVRELDASGTVSLRSFWVRRFRRLVPALVVLIGVCVVLVGISALEMRTRGIWGAVTYTTNWVHILGGSSYWDAYAMADPLEHLWSLAIEEQFYVVWPLVVLVVGRRAGRRGVTRLAGGLAVAALGLQLLGTALGWSIDRLYQGTDTRAFPFLLGGALASAGVPTLARRSTAVVSVASVAVLAAATIWLDGSDRSIFLGPLQLVSLAGIGVVAVAATSTSPLVCHAVPRAVGRWSYGIYLVHWPLVLALPTDMSPWMRAVVVTGASVAIAAASHRLVEHPIRLSGLSGWRMRVAPITAVGIVVAALAVATPTTPAAFADRPDEGLDWDAVVPLGPSTTEAPVPDAGLPTGSPSSGDTTVQTTAAPESTTTPPRAPRIAVVGDSVPALAADAVVAEGRSRGWQVRVVAEPGCVPSPLAADQYEPVTCEAFTTDLPDAVAGADAVIFWWGGTGKELSWQGSLEQTCDPEAGAAALDGRLSWMAGIVDGRPTALVVPVQRTDLDASNAAGTACEQAAYQDRVPPLGWALVRLDQAVCPSYPDDCARLDRYDGLHYSPESAPVAAGIVLDGIAPLLDGSVTAGLGDASAPTTTRPTTTSPSTSIATTTTVVTAPVSVLPDVPTVVVVGDSTAEVMAHGLDSTGRFTVIDGGVLGCPIVTTVAVRPSEDEERSTGYCPTLERQIAAIEMLSPDVVFVVSSPPEQWDHRYADDDAWHEPGDASWIAHHDAHMAVFVAAHPGLPIVLATAPPARPPSERAHEDPQRLAAWNTQIERWSASHAEAVVLDIAPWFPEPGSDEDRRMRPDGVHLTDEVVEELARDVFADALLDATRRALADIAAR